MHRTTFRIDEELLAEAKAMAARQHRSLNSVMEEALRRMLTIEHNVQIRPYVDLPVSGDPNERPLIDTSPAGLKEFLMQEDIEHYLRVVNDDDAHGH
ncbi:MAG: ribbon-helix-helix protein, CopG family [Streptosporangiaceae bacterium]|jgi:hypothetical protein